MNMDQLVKPLEVSVAAKVLRTDGSLKEDRGIVAYWHKDWRKRLAWRLRHNYEQLQRFPELGATVLTNAGKAIVTNRISGAGTAPNFVAWGTGAGTALVGDTTLFTEGPEARVTGTATRSTTNVTNDTYQVDGTITASAARAVTNAGTFDASTGGNIFVKGDFAVVNLATGESIAFTFKTVFA